MPRGKRLLALGIGTAVTAMLLTGCASPTPAATSSAPSPVATPTPAFTSDADAVAAAKAFYLKYLAAENKSVETGNDQPLSQYLTIKELADDRASEAAVHAKGERFSGHLSLVSSKPQSVNASSGKVSLYVCLDLKHARLLNAQGNDVTPTDRPQVQPLVVLIENLPSHALIAKSDTWLDSPIC